jgi:hypothetical protein
MAGTIIGFPRLPTPPQDVTVQYLNDLVRALETVIENLQNPGPQRGTNQTLTTLQNGNDVGLEPGALWVSQAARLDAVNGVISTLTDQDGYVRVTLLNVSCCSGVVGTGAIGTVTVAVS